VTRPNKKRNLWRKNPVMFIDSTLMTFKARLMLWFKVEMIEKITTDWIKYEAAIKKKARLKSLASL